MLAWPYGVHSVGCVLPQSIEGLSVPPGDRHRVTKPDRRATSEREESQVGESQEMIGNISQCAFISTATSIGIDQGMSWLTTSITTLRGACTSSLD